MRSLNDHEVRSVAGGKLDYEWLHGDNYEIYTGGEVPTDMLADASAWVPDAASTDPGGDFSPQDYFYGLMQALPHTGTAAAEALFQFGDSTVGLSPVSYPGDSHIVSKVFVTAEGQYFADRDGNGLIDAHFSYDPVNQTFAVDVTADLTAEYIYGLA